MQGQLSGELTFCCRIFFKSGELSFRWAHFIFSSDLRQHLFYLLHFVLSTALFKTPFFALIFQLSHDSALQNAPSSQTGGRRPHSPGFSCRKPLGLCPKPRERHQSEIGFFPIFRLTSGASHLQLIFSFNHGSSIRSGSSFLGTFAHYRP